MAEKREVRNWSNTRAHAKGHRSALQRPGRGKRGFDRLLELADGAADHMELDNYDYGLEEVEPYAEIEAMYATETELPQIHSDMEAMYAGSSCLGQSGKLNWLHV